MANSTILLVLILHLVVSDSLMQLTLQCKGDKSKLTNLDCERLGNIPGCYWLEDFNQYRSCGSLCNGAKANSLHEMKCKAYCEGKVQGFYISGCLNCIFNCIICLLDFFWLLDHRVHSYLRFFNESREKICIFRRVARLQ